MPFRNQPQISMIYGRDMLILDGALQYYDNRSHQLFVVDAGFEYDGASIPQPLWGLIGSPFDAEFRLPAAIHDFLYRNSVISKPRADQIFYDALRSVGVGYFKAQSMYLGVKLFGQSAYTAKMQNSF